MPVKTAYLEGIRAAKAVLRRQMRGDAERGNDAAVWAIAAALINLDKLEDKSA